MKTFRLPGIAILAGMLAACASTHNQAPVVDRPIISSPAYTPVADAHGYYTVRKGDTLYRIALDFGQSYQELVQWNHLADPNDIKVGQVLRVTPPAGAGGQYAAAQNGAQTSAVAAPSSVVETRTLPAPPSPVVPNKTSPRGEKRPYSDATLAEMEKPDNGSASPSPAGGASAPSPAAEAVGGEQAVSWTWPAQGKVVARFSESRKGIDIAGKSGDPVLAAAAGKVMYAGNGIRGYGNLVIVKHNSSLLSAYAHNKTILVKEGQSVTRGQKIAEMGDSDADSVMLHFEIRQQGKPVDPMKFLPAGK